MKAFFGAILFVANCASIPNAPSKEEIHSSESTVGKSATYEKYKLTTQGTIFDDIYVRVGQDDTSYRALDYLENSKLSQERLKRTYRYAAVGLMLVSPIPMTVTGFIFSGTKDFETVFHPSIAFAGGMFLSSFSLMVAQNIETESAVGEYNRDLYSEIFR
jgi:hypothetical protein